jgi:serine/threonine protein kinase
MRSVLDIGIQIAGACAHDDNCPRDLKPENIMIARDASQNLDFGMLNQRGSVLRINRTLGANDTGSVVVVVRTAAYMSPGAGKGSGVCVLGDSSRWRSSLDEMASAHTRQRETPANALCHLTEDPASDAGSLHSTVAVCDAACTASPIIAYASTEDIARSCDIIDDHHD